MVLQRGQAALSFRALGLAGADPHSMPAYEHVAGLDQSMWDDVQNFEWLMAFSIAFSTFWDMAKESFLDIAFTPFSTTT